MAPTPVAPRRAATYCLMLLGQDAVEVKPLLLQLAKDPHRGVSTYAREALAKLNGPK